MNATTDGKQKYPVFVGKMLNGILNHARLSVTLSVIFTLLMGASLLSLQTNPTTYLLDKQHPARIADTDLENHFTSTGAAISVVVTHSVGSILQTAPLIFLRQLTERLQTLNLTSPTDIERFRHYAVDVNSREKVRIILQQGLTASDINEIVDLRDYLRAHWTGYQSTDDEFFSQITTLLDPVVRVRSITNIEDLQDQDDLLEAVPLLPEIPETEAELVKLREKISQNPLVTGTFISDDQRAASLQIELTVPHDDAAVIAKAHQAVLALVADTDALYDISIGGSAVVTNSLSQYIKQDGDRFFPVVLAVIVVILALSFRTLEGVYIPLLVAIFSVVCTLGLLPLFGLRQNMITTMIPIFVMAVSVADAIHFLNEFYKNLSTNGQRIRRAIFTTFNQLFIPLSFTALTTMLGFVSLSYTEITFVNEFGIFVAVGVVFAYLFTLVLVPALLVLRTQRPPIATSSQRDSWLMRQISRFGAAIGVAVLKHRTSTLAALTLIVIASTYFGTQVRVDYEGLTFYPEDSRLRVDDAKIREHFKGVVALSIRLDADESGAFYREDVIRYIDQVESALSEHPQAGKIISPNTYLKRIHQVLNGAETNTLPADLSAGLPAQLFLLYDNSAGQDIRDVVDANYQHGRIVALLSSDRASMIKEVVHRFNAIPVPPGIHISLAGHGGVSLSATEEIVYGQLTSLFSSFFFILLIMTTLFRSVTTGLVTVMPLVFTLLVNFGVMGVLGLELDVATCLIAAIVFGVGDDYCIHFTEMYQTLLAKGLAKQDALLQTIHHLSQPLVVNSLSLAGGFLVLTISAFKPLIALGALMGMTMLVAALATLVIQPVLFSFLRLKALEPKTQTASAVAAVPRERPA